MTKHQICGACGSSNLDRDGDCLSCGEPWESMYSAEGETGRFRTSFDAGDFRQLLPNRPTMVQILMAIERVWGLEARIVGGYVGVEVEQHEKNGRIRLRQFRYKGPELIVNPASGHARWQLSCRTLDACDMDEFGYDRSILETIQIYPGVQTPLRAVLVPPFKDRPYTERWWWGLEEDADALQKAVEALWKANEAVSALLKS